MNRFLFVTAVAAALAACGSGDGNVPAGCLDTLTGGGTAVSVDSGACPGCTVTDANRSIDASADSHALIGYDTSGGEVLMRATAQPGVVFPAGNFAGALVQFPRRQSGGFSNVGISIRTYLNGVLQERVTSTQTTIGNVDGAGAITLYGGETGQAFDAVEASMNLGGGPATVMLYDFCADR